MSAHLIHTERLPVPLDDPEVVRRHQWRCERLNAEAPYPTHAERIRSVYFVDDIAGGPCGVIVTEKLTTSHLPATKKREERRND